MLPILEATLDQGNGQITIPNVVVEARNLAHFTQLVKFNNTNIKAEETHIINNDILFKHTY